MGRIVPTLGYGVIEALRVGDCDKAELGKLLFPGQVQGEVQVLQLVEIYASEDFQCHVGGIGILLTRC